MADGLKQRSGVTDSATAVAYENNTRSTLATAGSKLASWKNAGVEKLAISKDGEILTSGAGGTWVVRPAEGSAGIQAAITAASAVGGTVQLLSGTYAITSAVIIPGCNRLVIQGLGPQTILDNQQSAGAAVLNWADQRGGSLGSHTLNATTRGATSITFSTAANAANYLAGAILVITGIDADGFSRGELNEALATGDGGTGILTLVRPLQYSLTTSVTILGYLNGKDFVLKDFSVIHSSGSGSGISFFGIRGLVENVTLNGANFSDTSAGLSVNGYMTTVRNCFVLNYNSISAGNTQRGAIFFGIESLIEGCQFVNSGNNSFANNCGVELRSAYKVKFVNNTIRNCKAKGLRLIGAGPASECTITGNHIVNNDGIGIQISDPTQDIETIITDNHISYNTGNGIESVGHRAIICNNRVSHNGGNGIRAYGNDAFIDGNECSNNGGDGIAVGSGSTGLRTSITGNHCASNVTSGIGLYTGADNCVITGNIAANNTTRGIYLQGAVAGNTVSGNTSTGNTGNELEVDSTANNNLISSNNCFGGTISEGTGTNVFANNIGTVV